MADLKKERLGEGEALLKKLRRLRLRAAAAGKDDRKQLLALMDDIETVRRKLLRECAQLEEEFRVAEVRVTALNTYARVAQTGRRPPRDH
ncbi:hypothetical protein SSBR45G_42970 [Bradyrhizobium sp. SSBR45G]|uniref:hypothetical protein n=1 Tax=unclassified Bradyrhizobium TaxID=2631580 RepID=UPI0023429074|nr:MULTISPECIES: hypothetical protein [unclassified Bradyrhizobium]GLH79388.1 hypothetical protein SSBR45G_42970 [Bradyrhizobium sp. SSBR45G]GLH86676.1 hypothetical protein SSBR45R_41360 [Bradyrhizobium sp. SSBR45R]